MTILYRAYLCGQPHLDIASVNGIQQEYFKTNDDLVRFVCENNIPVAVSDCVTGR